MQRSIYVAEIIIDPSVEKKIRGRSGGGCTGDEVRQAFILNRTADLRWEHHERHGDRVVGTARTFAGRELAVALLPQDPEDGLWVLKTARPL